MELARCPAMGVRTVKKWNINTEAFDAPIKNKGWRCGSDGRAVAQDTRSSGLHRKKFLQSAEQGELG